MGQITGHLLLRAVQWPLQSPGPESPAGCTLSPSALPSYTNPDGRCPGLLLPGQMKAGTYKLTFDTEGYWKQRGQDSFYPYVEVRARSWPGG